MLCDEIFASGKGETAKFAQLVFTHPCLTEYLLDCCAIMALNYIYKRGWSVYMFAKTSRSMDFSLCF